MRAPATHILGAREDKLRVGMFGTGGWDGNNETDNNGNTDEHAYRQGPGDGLFAHID